VKKRLSRFAHFYRLDGSLVVYNALKLGVVILSPELEPIIKALSTPKLGQEILLSDDLCSKLEKLEIIVPEDYDENLAREPFVRVLDDLPIGVLYLVLTDNCNLRCKYCFETDGCSTSQKNTMTPIVAKIGLDLFARSLGCKACGDVHHSGENAQIVFYGGEPTLNPKTLIYALQYIEELKEKGGLPAETAVNINTNGTLITKRLARILAQYNVLVAVSLDGTEKQHDKMRVFPKDISSYGRVLKGVRLLKEAGARLSVSITVGPHNVDKLPEALLSVVDATGVTDVGFNLLMEGGVLDLAPDYPQKAADALIECFRIARERGIYEDRMMRKVNAFCDGALYLNDCAGCGQQIVVTPKGQVGVCQGYLGRPNHFLEPTVSFDPRTHPLWCEWRRRSPLNMSQCFGCEALGICGGGCPRDAHLKKGSIWELDDRFCMHAKTTLRFLLEEVVRVTNSNKI